MKRTKNSLLKSALALLLCVSMLVGSTFAWFTDSVTSGGNIIQSGNLELEMYWTDDLSSNVWHNVEDDAHNTIFTYENWEPGYTDVKYIKLVNKGNLALNYKLTLTPKGSVGKLAEVINVYFADSAVDVKSRADLPKLGAIGLLSNVLNGGATASGTLLAANQQSDLHPHGEIVMTLAMNMLTSAGNEYQAEDSGEFTITALATQASFEQDSFGSDYDNGAEYPAIITGDSVTQSVNAVDGKVPAGGVTMTGKGISAFVPGGAKMAAGADALTLSVTPMEHTTSDITVVNNEILTPVDVHISGLAADNTVPVVIDLGEVLPKYLNMGNYHLYHVENGANSVMTLVDDEAALTEHNRFTYDPLTGVVKVAMATFSEVALVADTSKAWEGKFDYSWYTNAVAPADGDSQTEYIIANADQLAAFGAIVGGMDGQTKDSFAGKTVKLISDINLGDSEKENNPNIIFYPIGYYNSEGTYERTNTAITSGLRNFEGTFDGNGHSISNFYQNTWEMKGDHDWYSPQEQYYRDGMGLFGRVYGGTVKNLTVKEFKSDGEITTTGCVAAYADGATFENIAIFNCNPRVYNIGNGGIVGCVGWYAKDADLKTTFKNITVDNSNKISALWGSYDVACGGVVGQYYPTSGQTSAGTPKNAGVHFENCHVSAQMDVYNDVCANYQYYAYRYAGMLIGSVRENVTIDGHSYPKMDGITAKDCTVHFGDWNDYYYCELVANSLASYTHDHQFSRLEQVAKVENNIVTYLDGTKETVTGTRNFVVVNGEHASENATCYHFKNGEVYNHANAGTETVDGVEVLKEDKQHIYLEFNNLVTGYGWGVTTKAVGDLDGVTILDREKADSVKKFDYIGDSVLYNSKPYTIGELFCTATIADNKLSIKSENVQVTVSPVGEENTVTGTYVANTDDWTKGTLTLSGTGAATITITDYYFCTPTTINVTITERQPEEKFDIVMNNGNFLHRVGNSGTVALDKLFKAKDGVSVGTVSVTVDAVNGSSASGTYSNNAIQFSGTGVVKVTITDNDYCIPAELNLEVVDAVNATAATSATKNNVVLLQNCGFSSLEVSGGYTLYGNGFTMTCASDSAALNTGYEFVAVNNGTLDNVQIKTPNFDYAVLYSSNMTESGNRKEETDRVRYFNVKSAIEVNGNSQILNSYISGGRAALNVVGGNVVVENSRIEGGAVASVLVGAANSLTLRDVTLVQKPTASTYDPNKKLMGFSVLFVCDANGDAAPVTLEGTLVQNAWVDEDDKQYVPSAGQSIISTVLGKTDYLHDIDGNGTNESLNLGFAYMPESLTSKVNTTTITDNRTNKDTVPYDYSEVSILNGKTYVYSYKNTKGTADSFKTENDYKPNKYGDIITVTYGDNTDGLESGKSFGTGGWVYELNVDLDKASGYKLDFSKLSMTVNGTTVTDFKVNGSAKPTSPVAVSAGGVTYTLTATIDGKEYTATYQVIGTETSKDSPSLVGTPSYGAGFGVANSYNGDWSAAAPVLDGITVRYWSVAESAYKEFAFSSITFANAGKQNGNNNYWEYTHTNNDFSLKVTNTTAMHDKSQTYGIPVVAGTDNKLYFTIASTGGFVSNGTTSRSIAMQYEFTDNNGGETLKFDHTFVISYDKDAQYKYSDFCSGTMTKLTGSSSSGGGTCLAEGTLITLADGTKKVIEDLRKGDSVMAFDHLTGRVTCNDVIIVVKTQSDFYKNTFVFDDGTELVTINEHGIYDLNLQKYVNIDHENYTDYIGHDFVSVDVRGKVGTKKLVAVTSEWTTGYTYDIVTDQTLNYVAEDTLSVTHVLVDVINSFDFDENMCYDQEKMQADIEKYGLYTYDEWAAYCDISVFEQYNIPVMKVGISKGLYTKEYIISLINTYVLDERVQIID